MKTSLHRIQTKDHLELHGLLYQPDKKTKTVVAHVHGMAGNFYEHRWLDNIAKTLTNNGIAFCPFNNRGNGHVISFIKTKRGKITYPRIGSSYEKFEDCLIDIKAQLDFLARLGFSRIHLMGHSLGAPKVAYYSAKTQDKRLKSLILLSPSDMLGLVRDDMRAFKKEIANAKRMKQLGRGRQLMAKAVWGEYPISANTYLNLFDDDSAAGIFNFHNPKDKFKILSQIIQPVFAAMGKKDHVLVIPIKDIMRIIKEKTSRAPRCETKILGNADHGFKGYEEKLADSVLKWIKSF